MSIESGMPSNHPILCCPLFHLPSIFPSIRVFRWVGFHIMWPKYWSFSINQYSELISFGTDCFDLPAVQGTLKSLLQHHTSKASILRLSAFFMVQLSHPYMTMGIALTRRTFVGKIMALFFNMLSRLVIAFLSRNKHLLISHCTHHLQWFWNPPKIVSHCFHCFPIYLSWSDGTGCHDLCFWMLSLSQLCHSPLSLSSKAR